MTAQATAPVNLEFSAGVAMLCREEGRTTDVRVLTRELSDALAQREAEHRDGDFLAALWTVVEPCEGLLTAARLRRTNIVH